MRPARIKAVFIGFKKVSEIQELISKNFGRLIPALKAHF